MAGTQAGGKLAAQKITANDPDFYKKIGSKGGSAKVPKGFATMTPEERRAAGKKGGKVSRKYGAENAKAKLSLAPVL